MIHQLPQSPSRLTDGSRARKYPKTIWIGLHEMNFAARDRIITGCGLAKRPGCVPTRSSSIPTNHAYPPATRMAGNGRPKALIKPRTLAQFVAAIALASTIPEHSQGFQRSTIRRKRSAKRWREPWNAWTSYPSGRRNYMAQPFMLLLVRLFASKACRVLASTMSSKALIEAILLILENLEYPNRCRIAQ